MRAQLIRIHSPDVESLKHWIPSDDDAILLQLIVGAEGEEGEESFDLTVCSVDWVARRAREDGLVDGRHHLVFERFDAQMVESFLRRRVSECVGENWNEVAARLAQIGRSEFEDYVEFNPD